MGVSDSKKKKSKKDDGKDDGCIGNHKVRTIILSILLIVFMVFVAAYWQARQDTYADLKKVCDDAEDRLFGARVNPLCDEVGYKVDDYYYSTTLALSGVFIVICGAICAALLFLLNIDILGKIAAFILLIGGLLYLIGGIWYFSKFFNEKRYFFIFGGVSALIQKYQNAMAMGWIGEVIFGGASALMLGLDAALGCYENEFNRIQSNLSMLFVVGVLCMGSYYAQICDPEDLELICDPEAICNDMCIQPEGVELIAAGWLIIFIVALVYMILMLLKCLSCGACECLVDNKCTRIVVAIALVVGGVMTAIGYCYYAGEFGSIDDVRWIDAGEFGSIDDDMKGKFVAYYIGISVLVCGLCVVWAADVAFDDFKNR